jgi:uncharacterized protein YlxP (DUF503 family)
LNALSVENLILAQATTVCTDQKKNVAKQLLTTVQNKFNLEMLVISDVLDLKYQQIVHTAKMFVLSVNKVTTSNATKP